MGPRNLLILFFSTVAVSLVILIIFFSLFFKNVDLSFNTKLPDSAPDLGKIYGDDFKMNPDSKANGLQRSTVNVPPESREPLPTANAEKGEEEEPGDNDLPPVSDDVVLEESLPPMIEEGREPPSAGQSATTRTGTEHGISANSARTTERRPVARPIERVAEPLAQPVQSPEPQPSGPPVPPQG
ncbi:MAG TPA: hypothetical protein V6C52_11895 [Coleofasciculaceae cyanobacterium]|jgi:hypothetical protein